MGKRGICMFNFREEKGFTLIELTITMAILSIILVFMSQLLNFNIRLTKTEGKKLEYTQNARIAANLIQGRIRQLDSSSVEYDDGGGGILVKVSNAEGSSVVLDTVAKTVNANNSLLWYYNDGSEYGELRDNSSPTNKVLAQYIRGINIARSTNGKYIDILIQSGPEEPGSKDFILSIPLKSTGDENTPSPTPTPSPLTEGLVGYPFNGNLEDTTPYETELFVAGPPASYVTGHTGEPSSAVLLSGMTYLYNDVHDADSEFHNNLDQTLWLDLWLKPLDSGRKMVIIDRTKNPGKNNETGFQLYIDSSNKIVLWIDGVTITSSATVGLNSWSHIKATVNLSASSNQLKMYLNDSLSAQGSIDITTLHNNNIELRLGCDSDGQNFFVGYLDDLLIDNSLF